MENWSRNRIYPKWKEKRSTIVEENFIQNQLSPITADLLSTVQ